MAENAANADAQAPAASGPSKTPLFLALVNSLAVMGALGMLIYTKVLFKRPAITEQSERERLAELKAKPVKATSPGLVSYEPMTANIQPTRTSPTDVPADAARMKLHYVTFELSLEISDASFKGELEDEKGLRPRILDKLLVLLGHKTFNELTTVQGRYMLRSQIGEIVNELVAGERENARPLVTNVFFKQFIVQ